MILDQRRLELAGRAAYEAYRIEVQGRSVRGEPLPTWSAQEERIRVAWRMAADAAVMVATGPQEPLPSRWQPVDKRFPAEPVGRFTLGPGPFLNTLDPVEVAAYERAHATVSVVADDSDDAELPGVGADGEAEGDQRERPGEQPEA